MPSPIPTPLTEWTLDVDGWLAAPMADTTVVDATAAVATIWRERVSDGAMSAQTLDKFLLLLRRFTRFSSAYGATSCDAITPAVTLAFITADGYNRHGLAVRPSTATRHQRRSVLRLFARDSMMLGFLLADPTDGVTLPPRDQADVRPVTDDEAALLRHFARSWGAPTRHAAVIGLALAGVRTGEIATIRVRDVTGRTVAAPGTLRVAPRTLPLDAWAARAIGERAAQVLTRSETTDKSSVVSTGGGTAAQQQARTCTAIRDVLIRAGLSTEPDLRPRSVTNYAAATLFARTGRIQDAAQSLGYASLDASAEAINWNWQSAP